MASAIYLQTRFTEAGAHKHAHADRMHLRTDVLERERAKMAVQSGVREVHWKGPTRSVNGLPVPFTGLCWWPRAPPWRRSRSRQSTSS